MGLWDDILRQDKRDPRSRRLHDNVSEWGVNDLDGIRSLHFTQYGLKIPIDEAIETFDGHFKREGKGLKLVADIATTMYSEDSFVCLRPVDDEALGVGRPTYYRVFVNHGRDKRNTFANHMPLYTVSYFCTVRGRARRFGGNIEPVRSRSGRGHRRHLRERCNRHGVSATRTSERN